MKKILLLTIGLCLLVSLAFAEPVYTEEVSYQIEILEDGQIQVRKATRIYKDGVEVGKIYHRHVLAPGVDTTKETKRVKDIANVVWTAEVIEEYETKKAEREINQ